MKLANKISILIVCSVFISAFSCPLLVTASPPPIVDYYATSWDVQEGTLVSGDLFSTKYNDENFFNVKAAWFWLGGVYFFAAVKFDFSNRVVDSVIVDLADNAPGGTMRVHVYYTSGDPDRFPVGGGHLSDGKYEFEVAGRTVDYVRITFSYWNLFGGDRYLKVDMVKLRRYNFPF